MGRETPADALGVRHPAAQAQARIVSLVPSITELLFSLGLGDQLVARTHYCIHPVGRIEAVPSVGGTKKIKHHVLKTLSPTHVIVNIDENTRLLAEQLAGYVPHIIVTHPNEPRDNPDLYRLIGGIFQRETEAERLCQQFAQALQDLQQAARGWPRRKVVYLIWRKPWMAVARDTYISHTLALVSWETLPAVTEPRYPVLEMTQALLNETDLVLFSTEPYRFQSADLEAFAVLYGCPNHKLALIDGEMISWYGSRAIQGLNYLRRFRESYATFSKCAKS